MFGRFNSGLCKKQGFTLIELLVVIAIIAILAAILFPVFTKARDQAKLSRCLAHLGQIGKAIQAYVDDNNGRYPIGPSYIHPIGDPNTLVGIGSWWTGQMVGGLKAGHGGSGYVVSFPKERPLYKYTAGNLDIWKCPSEQKQNCGEPPHDNEYPSDHFGSSYTMNCVIYWPYNGSGTYFYTLGGPSAKEMGSYSVTSSDPSKVPAPRKVSEVRTSSKIILMGERAMHSKWLEASGGGQALGHMGDKPFSPVVFCDGHCKTIMFDTDDIADPNGSWGFIQKGWHPNKAWKNAGI